MRPPDPADAAERELRFVRRQRVAAAAFIACYVVGWAWLVGLTDPAGWKALLAVGFGVLFALALLAELFATARSLRASGSQTTVPPNPPEGAAASADPAARSVLND